MFQLNVVFPTTEIQGCFESRQFNFSSHVRDYVLIKVEADLTIRTQCPNSTVDKSLRHPLSQ